MTMVVPCRLITRQRSHMGLTDGRTFISAVPVGDSTAAEVVRAELHLDHVSRKNADVVLAHLPGDGRQNVVPGVELHPEHRARERLDDLAFHLDLLFLLGHFLSVPKVYARTAKPRAAVCHRSKAAPAFVRIRGPSAVTAAVCSKWAARDSSTEEIDQSSSWADTSGRPAVIIGSDRRGLPPLSGRAWPRTPVVLVR